MKSFLPLHIVLLLCVSSSYAQFNSKLKTEKKTIRKDLLFPSPALNKYKWSKAVKAPLVLTAIGLYSMTDNEFLSREEVFEERNEYIPTFRHHADDYLQYAPIAAVYGLNALGIKGKTDFANRTAILIKAEIILVAITFPLKKITAVPRPDSGQPTSFPSGHTAQAFAAATFMAKEYGHKSIWYSIGAYSVATGVGMMRMMNNRHWVSDVLVGAGVGILSTNLAYLTHQYKWGKKRKHSTLIIPTYDGKTGMVSLIRGL